LYASPDEGQGLRKSAGGRRFKDGGFLICRRPTLDLHQEKHRLAAKRLMLQANAGVIRLIAVHLQLVVLKNQMRLSKTAIHQNHLSANRSASQQECAQLIVDTNCRFIDGLF